MAWGNTCFHLRARHNNQRIGAWRSTTARLLSLTVRLWANIFASDMIYGLFLSLTLAPVVWGWEKSPVLGVILGIFPALIPLAFIALHIFVSIVQTYVFTILPAVYIGLATAEEH